jgi:hypothetical protein
MKLRLMLWLLGWMLKRALRRKPAFRETLAEIRRLDWGIATEDLSIARHYLMSPQGISRPAPGCRWISIWNCASMMRPPR